MATVLFQDPFSSVSSGVITNEYAHYNPSDPASRKSNNWSVTSGSLFGCLVAPSDYGACSGVPNDIEPNATSSNGNGSAIFRMNSKRFNFLDSKTIFRLYVKGLVTTPSTPSVAWDGIHIFLRYQSQYNLYYASVSRRDGTVVIKKKCVGGSENGGTYYVLASRSGYPQRLNFWNWVGASVKNNTNGSVTIRLFKDHANILTATDSGLGCAPIRKAGATGIRGDNCNFRVKDLRVEQA